MPEEEQNKEGGQQKPKEVMIPASQVKGFLTEMMASVKKDREEERGEWKARDEARDKEVADLTKRMNELESDPLGKYTQGMDKKAVELFQARIDDGSLEKAVQPVLQNLLPQKVMEQLPELVKKQGGLIAEITREKLEDQVPNIADRVLAKEEEKIKQGVADAYNKLEGVQQPATFDETVRRREQKRKADDERHKKNRRRNKIIAVVGTTALALLAIATGWTAYSSSKRTAEGATGTANRAMAIAKEAKGAVTSYRTENETWKVSSNAAKKKEEDARNKREGELEEKLREEIAKKVDKLVVDAQIADLDKNYKTLDATLKAELAKNTAREEAYTKYTGLADATKKSLDELAKNYGEFSRKAASGDEVNAELTKIRQSIADTDANIKKYSGIITQLQAESGANVKGYTELSQNYRTVLERVKKIEEELKKYPEKPENKPL